MLHEAGQIRRATQRKPLDGPAIFAGNGGEGSPLVRGKLVRRREPCDGIRIAAVIAVTSPTRMIPPAIRRSMCPPLNEMVGRFLELSGWMIDGAFRSVHDSCFCSPATSRSIGRVPLSCHAFPGTGTVGWSLRRHRKLAPFRDLRCDVAPRFARAPSLPIHTTENKGRLSSNRGDQCYEVSKCQRSSAQRPRKSPSAARPERSGCRLFRRLLLGNSGRVSTRQGCDERRLGIRRRRRGRARTTIA